MWRNGHIVAEVTENSPTRETCFDAVRARLAELVANGGSVLLAFDFPDWYPAGFARALALSGAPWRAVWDELKVHVADEQAAGTNNRFDLASDLNRRMGAADGPFWGHPHGRTCARLRPKEPAYPVSGLARLREADRHPCGVQPVWKLWGNGSVGSQSPLGIPLLARLRDDHDLRRASAVWPFETGSVLPPRDQEPRIIFAEIYPSLVPLPPQPADSVKDSVQAEAIGRHLARHDAADTLSVSRASQLARFGKWKRVNDLRGKATMFGEADFRLGANRRLQPLGHLTVREFPKDLAGSPGQNWLLPG